MRSGVTMGMNRSEDFRCCADAEKQLVIKVLNARLEYQTADQLLILFMVDSTKEQKSQKSSPSLTLKRA